MAVPLGGIPAPDFTKESQGIEAVRPMAEPPTFSSSGSVVQWNHNAMQLRTLIEQLGYSPHEAAVYLAALELGGSTETEIAEKAKLPRTTAASVIDALHKKGLMSAYLKGRRKIWSAENPERFMSALRDRETLLQTMLPELQSLRHEIGAQTTIRIYSGAEEIKQIMRDIIETKHHFSAVMSWDDWQRFLGKQFLDDYIETRKRHFLKIRLITPKTKLSLALKERDAKEERITQFLPESVSVNNCTLVYDNKVALISINSKHPTGILIEDHDIHQMMSVFFESLWLRSGGTFDQLS